MMSQDFILFFHFLYKKLKSLKQNKREITGSTRSVIMCEDLRIFKVTRVAGFLAWHQTMQQKYNER